jgi:hypothetical protein
MKATENYSVNRNEFLKLSCGIIGAAGMRDVFGDFAHAMDTTPEMGSSVQGSLQLPPPDWTHQRPEEGASLQRNPSRTHY